jgi:RNase P subunit RPR2
MSSDFVYGSIGFLVFVAAMWWFDSYLIRKVSARFRLNDEEGQEARIMSVNDNMRLHPAVWWVCPSCGHTNYDKCIPVELTNEDREHMPWAEDSATGDWVAEPSEVTCKQCRHEFEIPDDTDNEEKQGS